jgi:hypothetical protein
MNEPWYKKVIAEYRKEVVNAAIMAFVATFVFSLLYFILGKNFEWRTVNLSEPTLTLRLLSGLVFSSLGRVLYKLKFYYVLKVILVYVLRARDLYYALKKIIWYFLMFVMGYYIVPWVMNAINFILTILLNVVMFVAYIAPLIGVFVVVFIPVCYFLKKRGTKKTEAIQ